MTGFGDIIRKLRTARELPLRTVAAFLDTDQAILSKIERGQRTATRKQVLKLAGFFKTKKDELLIPWLSDKLVKEVGNEAVAVQALQAAKEIVGSPVNPAAGKSDIIHSIKTVLKKDGRVAAAWLFGSYARGEAGLKSDVDIMIELNGKRKYSMFDVLDIGFLLEKKINKKIDLVEKDTLMDFAMKTASADLIKIYG